MNNVFTTPIIATPKTKNVLGFPLKPFQQHVNERGGSVCPKGYIIVYSIIKYQFGPLNGMY